MPDFDQDMEMAGSGSRWLKTAEGVGGAKPRASRMEDSPANSDSSPCCRVSRDGFLGRHLVATRDIAAGEVVLQEAPLVSGPAPGCAPCCVACYCPLQRPGALGMSGALSVAGAVATSAIECPMGCGWPVCSELCSRSSRHQPECEFTRKHRGDKVVVDWGGPNQLFDSLIVLRCLALRETDPAAWSKLVALESHCAKRKETGRYERDRLEVSAFLRANFKLRDTFTDEQVLKLCGAVQINGYGVRLTEPPHCAVYDTLSFIEHDCVPNCSKSWSAAGVLTVRAVDDVPRGAHLSICYVDPTLGTRARRARLACELLACRCRRCADPAELDTFYSAVRCTAVAGSDDDTCEGYLLPVDPLADPGNDADNSPWRCGACDRQAHGHDVNAVLLRLQRSVSYVDRGSPAALTALLSECQLSLHADHFLPTEVRIALAPLLGAGRQALRQLGDDDLRRKVDLCRDVLRLADVLFKGVTRVSGVLRYELHRSLLEDARRKAKHGEQRDVAQQWTEARSLLVEATSILRFEPDVLPEGRVALRALRSLEDLEAAFRNVTIHASSEQ